MAQFHRLPSRIQETAQSQLAPDEEIRLCALGRSNLLSPDFVIITSNRVLVLDERQVGSLNTSYINIRCDLAFSRITAVTLDRSVRHFIFGQADLGLSVNGGTYLICNMSHREARRVLSLISSRIGSKKKSTQEIK